MARKRIKVTKPVVDEDVSEQKKETPKSSAATDKVERVSMPNGKSVIFRGGLFSKAMEIDEKERYSETLSGDNDFLEVTGVKEIKGSDRAMVTFSLRKE